MGPINAKSPTSSIVPSSHSNILTACENIHNAISKKSSLSKQQLNKLTNDLARACTASKGERDKETISGAFRQLQFLNMKSKHAPHQATLDKIKDFITKF